MSIINWYEKIDKQFIRKPKRDKNFSKHLIEPCSMISCIGGTGSGKSNALVNFLSLKNDAFHKIVIFSGSTTDEPLYSFLQNKIPELEMYNDINELPSLDTYDDDDKGHEKLIVFDDFINLKKKEMTKINEFLTSGRKFGFTCFVMGQNYTSIPKIITRNSHYFIVFRLGDNTSINNIIRNHNTTDIKKDDFKKEYLKATEDKGDFFMIDLKNPSKPLRKNFAELI
jgi:hypothetical protein